MNIHPLLRTQIFSTLFVVLAAGFTLAQQPAVKAPDSQQVAAMTGNETLLQRAARTGDLALLRSRLHQGVSPNARDPKGRTALLVAAASGQIEAMRLLLDSGAHVNLATPTGRTPLIQAAISGQTRAVQTLIKAGADLNRRSRGNGTAIEAAERLGHNEIAAILRKAGARTFGRSVGDTICVRPWNGDGYCGIVEAINRNEYRIRITKLIGCLDGCEPKPGCSAGKPVGGINGLRSGGQITIPSWCITHTDVKP